MRTAPIMLLLAMITCCAYSHNTKPLYVNYVKNRDVTDEAQRVKAWLLSNIARFFKESMLKDDTRMFTKQYLEYKHDAIGRDFDGLTNEQFARKWKSKYNTKLANRNSVLIGQQDWINPRVTHLVLKNKLPNNCFMFSVIIEDSDSKNRYTHKRDIKVIPSGNSFIIDDILEYDN